MDVWIVVGTIAYAGDTVVGAFSDPDVARSEAARLNREGDLVIFDAGYEVRGPFKLDAPAVANPR